MEEPRPSIPIVNALTCQKPISFFSIVKRFNLENALNDVQLLVMHLNRHAVACYDIDTGFRYIYIYIYREREEKSSFPLRKSQSLANSFLSAFLPSSDSSLLEFYYLESNLFCY